MFPKHIIIHTYKESSLLDSGIDVVHTLKQRIVDILPGNHTCSQNIIIHNYEESSLLDSGIDVDYTLK